MTGPEPGFYWARHKDDGELTVVQITKTGDTLGVMLIGNLSWPDLDEAKETFDILKRIPEPVNNR